MNKIQRYFFIWLGTLIVLLLTTKYIIADWYLVTIFALTYVLTNSVENLAKRGTRSHELSEKVKKSPCRLSVHRALTSDVVRFAVFVLIVVVVGAVGSILDAEVKTALFSKYISQVYGILLFTTPTVLLVYFFFVENKENRANLNQELRKLLQKLKLNTTIFLVAIGAFSSFCR